MINYALHDAVHEKTDLTRELPMHFPQVAPKTNFIVILNVWTLTAVQIVLYELEVYCTKI